MLVRFVIAALSLLSALAAAAQTPAPQAAPQAGLIAPGRSPELEILFTGDVIGFLEPCG
jgi:hypothetical protein